MLENANAQFVFPDEVKAYISSHFQMIREENDSLRKSLSRRTKQLDKMRHEHRDCERNSRKLGEAEKKLDRERMKAR